MLVNDRAAELAKAEIVSRGIADNAAK